MTVYKAIKKEADAAAELAIALAKGEQTATGQSVTDPEGNRDVPPCCSTPKAITKENVKDVVADGYVDQGRALHRRVAAKCTDGRHQLTRSDQRLTPGDRDAARHGTAVRTARPSDAPRYGHSDPKETLVSATPLLELRGIDKSFGPVQVLHDVDFSAYAGRGDRARRRQRRRQVHAGQMHRRHLPASTPASSSSRASR